jgi:hypothetical protein
MHTPNRQTIAENCSQLNGDFSLMDMGQKNNSSELEAKQELEAGRMMSLEFYKKQVSTKWHKRLMFKQVWSMLFEHILV